MSYPTEVNSDRFVLNRSRVNVEEANFWLNHPSIKDSKLWYLKNTRHVQQDLNFREKVAYAYRLCHALDINPDAKILRQLSTDVPRFTNGIQEAKHWPVRPRLKRTDKPQMTVLDLPNIRNDISSNVLHWSSSDHIVAALDKTIYLWHVGSSRMSDNIVCICDVVSLRMNLDSSMLAFACKENTGSEIKLWDSVTTEIVQKRKVLECNHICYITSIEFHPSNKYIIIGCKKGNIATVTMSLRRISNVEKAHCDLEIIKIKCSPDGRYVASCGFDGYLRLWNFPNLELLYAYSSEYCARVGFTPGLSWHPWRTSDLCIGNTEGTIALINSATGKFRCRRKDVSTIVYDLTFNKLSGELVISQIFSQEGVSSEYKYQINVLTNLDEVVDRFEGHLGRILYLEWSPDNQILASASADETIHFWKFFNKSPKRVGVLNKSNLTKAHSSFNLLNFTR